MDFQLMIRKFFSGEEKKGVALTDLVEDAKEDWMYAKKYFDSVSEPDLIDYAIHMIMATERRYMYLLKCARIEGAEDGITNELYLFNKRMTG